MRKKPLIACALLIVPALLARADTRPEALVIIAKKGSRITSLSSRELLKIYRGEEKKADDGTRFVLSMRENGSPERAAFLQEVLHMSEQEYQKYFLQAVFTGLVKSPPKVVNGPDSLRTFIESNDGAIGFARQSDAESGFTVVAIDGKKPGDDGYPLTLK